MAGTLWSNTIVCDNTLTDYWNNETILSGASIVPLAAADIGGSRVNYVFTRAVPSTVSEDVEQFHIDMTLVTGGGPYAMLTDAQKTTAETALLQLWTDLKPYVATNVTLKELQWRDWRMSGPRDKNGILKLYPLNRLTPVGTVGTDAGNNRLPDQVAATVTYETASRHHWGRSYVPAACVNQVSAYGRVMTAEVDALALAFRTAFNTLNGLGAATTPVVLSQKYRAFLNINKLQVDNVFDIQRRRRAKFGDYRKAYTS